MLWQTVCVMLWQTVWYGLERNYCQKNSLQGAFPSCEWYRYLAKWLHGQYDNKTKLFYSISKFCDVSSIFNNNSVIAENWIYIEIKFFPPNNLINYLLKTSCYQVRHTGLRSTTLKYKNKVITTLNNEEFSKKIYMTGDQS